MSEKVPSNVILIDSGRVKAIEEDFGDTYGKDREFFIKALREASQRLNTYLVTSCEQVFSTSKDIAATGVNNYALPEDVYAEQFVYEVYFSETGKEGDLYPLDHYPRRLFSEYAGYPSKYSIYQSRLWLDCQIRSPGILRVEYEQIQPLPDLPRGTVLSRTLSATQITTLQLDTGTVNQNDTQRLDDAQFVCTHTKRGARTMKAIPVNGYDVGSGQFTIDPYTFAAGETVNIGDIITLGRNTTTHLDYDIICETFLVEYLRTEAELIDSSIDYADIQRKLDRILAEIAGVYNALPSGPTKIVQL